MPDKISMTDAVLLFKSGSPCAIGEYRSTEAETIPYRDKESGRSMSFSQIRHVVEFGPKSVQVQERVPDNFDPTKYRSPFKKGGSVFVHIASLEQSRGVLTIRGSLTAIEG